MAGSTGLEPAASGVTGRRSNQLNYDPKRCVRPPLPLRSYGETSFVRVLAGLSAQTRIASENCQTKARRAQSLEERSLVYQTKLRSEPSLPEKLQRRSRVYLTKPKEQSLEGDVWWAVQDSNL